MFNTVTSECCVKKDNKFMMTFYLRGPQRVRPKKPRREITQLKTPCLSNLIHCKTESFIMSLIGTSK